MCVSVAGGRVSPQLETLPQIGFPNVISDFEGMPELSTISSNSFNAWNIFLNLHYKIGIYKIFLARVTIYID